MQEEDKGGLVYGKKHEECDHNGCGEKYMVDQNPEHIVELEEGEAVIVPEAFDEMCFIDSFCNRPNTYKMTGTIKQIASALNTLGGGKNFEAGAKVWKNGRKMNKPRLTAKNKEKSRKNIKSGSVIINRTNMNNPEVMTFEGTAYEIASQINSYGGNGVELKEQGGEIKKHGGKLEEKREKRPIKVRFHLGRGKDYMTWRIEETDTKEVVFLPPEEVQIIMQNCKLTNNVKRATKIFTGEINKEPIAFIQCKEVTITDEIEPVEFDEKLSYNPRKSPNWLDADGNIVDNFVFDKLITYNRGVYYYDGDKFYKLGGYINDSYEFGGKLDRVTGNGIVDYGEVLTDLKSKGWDSASVDLLTEFESTPFFSGLSDQKQYQVEIENYCDHCAKTFFRTGGQLSRYLATAEFYVWADNPENAKYKAVKTIPSNQQPVLTELYYTPERTMFAKKLFKEGGKIEYSDEDLAKIVEKTAKNLKKFRENFIDHKGYEIATMVANPNAPVESAKQREQLINWIKEPKNNVKVIVAFSGGKDSVAMVFHLLYEVKVRPDQIELWHHDVDGNGEDLFDWKCTPSYCQAFADELGLPILFSYRDGGLTGEIFREDWSKGVYFQEEAGGEYKYLESMRNPAHKQKRIGFPQVSASLETRWCSGVAKIDVMSRAINNTDRLKEANIVVCTGERRLESKNRSFYLEVEPYRSMTKQRQAIQWRPVIDYTEEEIWQIYEDNLIQPHPAYEIGWGGCSCQTCIFNGKDQWATINEISPEKIKRIVEIEDQKGRSLYNQYHKKEVFQPERRVWTQKDQMEMPKLRTYKAKTVLKDDLNRKMSIYESHINQGKSFVDLSNPDEKYWVDQALGKFTAPIINIDWKLPKGAFSGDDCGAN